MIFHNITNFQHFLSNKWSLGEHERLLLKILNNRVYFAQNYKHICFLFVTVTIHVVHFSWPL